MLFHTIVVCATVQESNSLWQFFTIRMSVCVCVCLCECVCVCVCVRVYSIGVCQYCLDLHCAEGFLIVNDSEWDIIFSTFLLQLVYDVHVFGR